MSPVPTFFSSTFNDPLREPLRIRERVLEISGGRPPLPPGTQRAIWMAEARRASRAWRRSYLETELFEAALLGKPSYVFLLKGN